MFEMDDNQKSLFDALTPLQKQVSLNSISGMSDIDSYKNSNGKAKTQRAMESSVNQILRKRGVKEFIRSMAEHIVNPAIMGRDEMMRELTLMARTYTNDLITWGYREIEVFKDGKKEKVLQSFWSMKPTEEINPEHLGSIEEVTASKDGLKFKKTSRRAAMKQLSELAGYDAATKYDHSSKDGTMSPKGKSLDDFYEDNE